MVRFARLKDYPTLISMWQSCFNESLEAAGFIFSRLQKPQNILVLEENDKITAMLSINEFRLASIEESLDAAYIYGVATSPDERGKGYSTVLLDEAHELLLNKGIACSVLVPANTGLFDFYKKRGYETAFNINKTVIDDSDIQPVQMRGYKPLSAERFAILRDFHFSRSKMFARFSEKYLSYILEESEFYGGEAFEFEVSDKPCFAVFQRFGDEITVKELGAESTHVDEAIAMIKAKFPAKRYTFRLREDVKTSYTNNLLPFGMLRWYYSNGEEGAGYGDNEKRMLSCGGEAAYLSHALD